MARDARGHEVRPGKGTVVVSSRLQVSLEACAAEFGLSVAELEEYIAVNLDRDVARARGSQGAVDQEYTRKAFPVHVRRVLNGQPD